VTSGDWKQAQAHYRELLFGTGAAARDGNASISAEDLQRVTQQGGILSHAAVLRCRLRFFSDGAVLGSRVFVALHLARFLKTSAPPKPKSPHSLPVYTNWGDLATMRRVRLRYSSD
jgi:putative transposase